MRVKGVQIPLRNLVRRVHGAISVSRRSGSLSKMSYICVVWWIKISEFVILSRGFRNYITPCNNSK